MVGSILGTRVLRTEDPELLLGQARYVTDLELDHPLHVVFVRSEMAHARITAIDTSSAMSAPGVVAVYTAQTLGLAAKPSMVNVHDDFLRPPLAVDKVRFVGEAIVAVLAETETQAKDAADMVVVDYEPLTAVVHPEDALADGASVLFEAHGDNVAITTTDPVNDQIFGDADVIVRGRYVNQRMAVAPMEPHGAAAQPDGDGRLLVFGSTQMPHLMQQLMARALELAVRGEGLVEPNPMVGCVIARDGVVLGEGWHQRFGQAHAEIESLKKAGDVRGATLYVTLEPCCHTGKTPPCTEAVIAAGIKRVVCAMRDPFPQVAGQHRRSDRLP